MPKWMNRRQLIGMVVGTFGGALGAGRARAQEESSASACYWRHVSSKCSNGTVHEYWCYRCCGLTGCGDVYCEWRVVGTC